MKTPITRSFNKVDTDLFVRNLIFSILYISVILGFFNYLLWPTIIAFKSQYILERKEKIIYNEIKKGYDNSAQRLQDFITNNRPIFAKLSNQNALEEVKSLIASYLTIKSIKQVQSSTQEDNQTINTTYAFTTQTKHVANMWQLMEKLSTLNASVVINPPVQINRASLQADVYDISFSLEIVYNTYQIPTHTQKLLEHLPN